MILIIVVILSCYSLYSCYKTDDKLQSNKKVRNASTHIRNAKKKFNYGKIIVKNFTAIKRKLILFFKIMPNITSQMASMKPFLLYSRRQNLKPVGKKPSALQPTAAVVVISDNTKN